MRIERRNSVYYVAGTSVWLDSVDWALRRVEAPEENAELEAARQRWRQENAEFHRRIIEARRRSAAQ